MENIETVDSVTEDTADAVDIVPKAKLLDAIKSRDKAKDKLREVESMSAQMRERLELLETEVASKEKDSGEISKVIERLERKAEKLEKENREFRELEVARVTEQRKNALLDGLQKASGVADRVLLDALVDKAAALRGVDSAPEELDDDRVTATLEALKDLSPSVFVNAEPGGTPGMPGTNLSTKSKNHLPASAAVQSVRELAEKYSRRRQ